ncbi:putative DNA-binding domain-containing protein [Inhella sp.]|uniref:HvfC/BufC family peptide modification chaperone n=1 Tax=Inhella sp. TaxID=1921806 RepID=UPI0035B2A7BD
MTADAQARLVQAIWGPEAPAAGALEAAGLSSLGGHGLARGLAAYREHAKALSVRVLAAAYPRVQAWLGSEDFAGLAWAFARRQPPQEGDLARWGAALPAFLAELPEVEPELPALAALDWALHALSWQADEYPQTDLLEQLQGQGDGVLTLSAHLRRLQLPAGAWACAEAVGAPAWQAPGAGAGQGELLVWRQGWRPCWAPLPPGWGLWLQRLQDGATLGAAIEAALEAAPDFHPGQALHTALAAGWLLGLQP